MRRYLLILLGIPLAGLPAGAASCEGRSIDRALRAYAVPPSGEATVTGKETVMAWGRKGRRTTIYKVALDAPGGAVTRRVGEAEYALAAAGRRTAWHVDPQSGEGLSEIERGYRTDPATHGILLLLAVVVAFLSAGGTWKGLPGGGAEGRARRGGSSCPEIRELRLPRPPRDPGRWEDWLARKYPRPGFLLWPFLGLALLVSVPAVLLGGWELAFVQALLLALTASVVLAATVRGKRRDRILWARGEERHARAATAKRTGNVRSYEVSYEFGGESWTLRQRMPIEGEALRGKGETVVVLVDPLRPSRATVAPRLGI